MTGCKTTSVMKVPARAMRAMRATAATAAAAVAADFAKRAILDVNHISHTGRPIFRLAVNSAKTCASALGYSPGAGLTHRRSLLAGPVCTASLLMSSGKSRAHLPIDWAKVRVLAASKFPSFAASRWGVLELLRVYRQDLFAHQM